MTTPLSPLEQLKLDSHFLRGTINDGLADPVTGAISDDDNKLLKFHGSYQQDDRDVRDERRKRKLEPAYSFMIRARLPGGIVTPKQWLELDHIATKWSTRGLRITTRQTFQWHGVLKRNLKTTMQALNDAMATTLAACGDVNRQVVGAVNPNLSKHHHLVSQWAQKLSDHFLPRTGAYHEIWLNGEKHVDTRDEEPLYGLTYLPRKFKMGVTIPPLNDIDVFAQDLGLIAIIDDDQLQGFNVVIGGGMGATHGDPTTYPRLGSVIGFVAPEHLIAVAEAVVLLQRDHGNRDDRRYARLKYTVDRLGPAWFKAEIEKRAGVELQPTREFKFEHNGDHYGWKQGSDGKWHLGLYIESGRLWDENGLQLLTGMREIARVHTGEFHLTCNQNVVIVNVNEGDKDHIDELVGQYGLDGYRAQSGIRRHSLACVALPTCGLAMAEAERYSPVLLPKLESLLEKHRLLDAPILLRLSGCPNGCSRPYLGEIALVGRAPGRYDLRLAADFTGQRLNSLYKENITEPEILLALDDLFAAYSTERLNGEHFGDFLIRHGTIAPPEQKSIPIVLEAVAS